MDRCIYVATLLLAAITCLPLGATELSISEQELMERPEKEISVSYIGERVMDELRQMDDVAYVRFASVYRSFRDIEEFMTEIKELYELKEARERRLSQNGPPDEEQGLQDSP